MDKRFTALLKWTGTLLTLAGALAVSFQQDPLNVILFNLGAMSWLWAAIRMRETSLIAVNAGLLTIYMFGAIIRIVN